jgi:large subunit ribosomal protein L29
MANKRAAEFRNLGDSELVDRLAEAREELFNLRFQNVTGQLDGHARISEVRKDIARIQTLLREREIQLAEQNANANG